MPGHSNLSRLCGGKSGKSFPSTLVGDNMESPNSRDHGRAVEEVGLIARVRNDAGPPAAAIGQNMELAVASSLGGSDGLIYHLSIRTMSLLKDLDVSGVQKTSPGLSLALQTFQRSHQRPLCPHLLHRE